METSSSQSILALSRLLQEGALPEAEFRCREMIARHPKNAEVWNMLGIILHQGGRTAEAVAAMENAVRLAPHGAEAWHNLGNMLREAGRGNDAIPHFRRVLALSPKHVGAHVGLARVLADHGEFGEAERMGKQAVSLNMSLLDTWASLAYVQEKQGAFDKAAQTLTSARRYQEGNPDLWVLLGCAHLSARQLSEAAIALRRALELNPCYLPALSNLGNVLREQGHLDEAEACFREAIQVSPMTAEIYGNLAAVLISKKHHAAALECLDKALSLRDNYPEAHFVRGLALLVQGDLTRGWPEYAYRWQTSLYLPGMRNFSQPEWHGETLSGKTLLVHAEQGMGDTLQFVRYAPVLKALSATVIVECQPPLKRLLARMAGIDCLLSKGDELPTFDLHVPLLNVPGAVGATLDNLPNEVPYLSADPDEANRWQQRMLALGAGLRVGIAWAGNPLHQNDRNRSMPPEALSPLATLKHVKWFNLQKRDALETPGKLPPGMELIDWTDDLGDFADTAALIANLDLVIAVDTSVAHLAGALGRPTWVMVPHAPDWRWLLDREDSPWYPTVRLFRQGRKDDWAGVVDAVAQALGQLAA